LRAGEGWRTIKQPCLRHTTAAGRRRRAGRAASKIKRARTSSILVGFGAQPHSELIRRWHRLRRSAFFDAARFEARGEQFDRGGVRFRRRGRFAASRHALSKSHLPLASPAALHALRCGLIEPPTKQFGRAKGQYRELLRLRGRFATRCRRAAPNGILKVERDMDSIALNSKSHFFA
jgi:hypothetical protein